MQNRRRKFTMILSPWIWKATSKTKILKFRESKTPKCSEERTPKKGISLPKDCLKKIGRERTKSPNTIPMGWPLQKLKNSKFFRNLGMNQEWNFLKKEKKRSSNSFRNRLKTIDKFLMIQSSLLKNSRKENWRKEF